MVRWSVKQGVAAVVAGACLALLPGYVSALGGEEPEGDPIVAVVQPDEYELPAEVPGHLEASGAELAGLVDEYDAEYAGSYYDPSVASNVIVATTEAAAQRVVSRWPRLHHISIKRATYSWRDLMGFTRRILADPELLPVGDEMLFAAPDPHRNGVSLYTSRAVPTEMARRLASSIPAPLTVYPRFPLFREHGRHLPFPKDRSADSTSGGIRAESRQSDPSPYSGGMAYKTGYGSTRKRTCTAGFGYQEGGSEFVLTAGHCYEYNTGEPLMFAGDSGVAGEFNNRTTIISRGAYFETRATADGGYHGDLALVNVTKRGNAVGSRMWVGGADTTTKWPVVSRQAPQVGTSVCSGGAVTGDQCVWHVLEVNGVFQTSNMIAWPVDFAGGYMQVKGGDSGGPVFRYVNGNQVEAVGVLQAHRANAPYPSGIVFTGVEEAMQAWGGGLDFN